MFVSNEPVAVQDEAGNIIYIRPKMGKGIEAQVSAEFGRLGGKTQTAYEFALLACNIVRWEGPAFTTGEGKPIAATRANIDRLDPDEPLVAATVRKIVELNTRRTAVPAANGAAPVEDDPTLAAAPTWPNAGRGGVKN